MSGFNGCRGPRSRVTRGLSRLLALAFVSFVSFLGSCLSLWLACSMRCPRRLFFSSSFQFLPGNVSAAYGRSDACWAFLFSRCLVGSLSPWSSDSQAAGRSQPATHALTSVVLPKPAGAEMRVSLRCKPSFRRLLKRGRGTRSGRGGGI